ncbi:transglycosylase SLT domain-containing protein [Salmonella enterica]|uniref:transglycosylase SLT domain-containing protein n=1 Tax=Salmonella enterica TaxID=28901 RepID=UPI003BC4F045
MKKTILAIATFSLLFGSPAFAGGQQYEVLSASVKALMAVQVSASSYEDTGISSVADRANWIAEIATLLVQDKRFSGFDEAKRFLGLVYYEAKRAGLDPDLVVSVIDVESKFNRYAISPVGARGLMQVMPFWTNEIGNGEADLFPVRTNLRYGCTILRHYLDKENGNLFYALGRYNGSRGSRVYPDLIMAALSKYKAASPASQGGYDVYQIAKR